MIFETHVLPESLTPYIDTVFYYNHYSPDHSIQRVVPTGHIFLIFELDGILRNTFDRVSLEVKGTFQEAWVSGMHKNYLSISAHQASEMLVVQFNPAGSFPILHLPAHEINDQVVPATELLGDEIIELRSKILEASSAGAKFKIIESWLLQRLDVSKKPTEELVGILKSLRSNPVSHHSEIIDAYSKSQKHLIAQFKKHFGLTPKVVHRIYRFNELLQQIHTKKTVSWSDITYDFGYADQSHFIKEFKEFSGFNPQEFIDAGLQNEEPNFFPLDRKEG